MSFLFVPLAAVGADATPADGAPAEAEATQPEAAADGSSAPESTNQTSDDATEVCDRAFLTHYFDSLTSRLVDLSMHAQVYWLLFAYPFRFYRLPRTSSPSLLVLKSLLHPLLLPSRPQLPLLPPHQFSLRKPSTSQASKLTMYVRMR